MSTIHANPLCDEVTEESVIGIIAEALDVSRAKLTRDTQAADICEWDSMGTLSLLSGLDRHGIQCDLGNTTSLQSVAGVIEIFRTAGKLR